MRTLLYGQTGACGTVNKTILLQIKKNKTMCTVMLFNHMRETNLIK